MRTSPLANGRAFRRAAALLVSGIVFTQNGAFAQSVLRLPDMSAYNCAGSTATTETRHIGQVIRGQYHEWYESYVAAGTGQRLACISIVRPASQQLTTNEAAAFLKASFAVGEPTADAPEAGASESPEPTNVKPEPLKGLRQNAASSSILRSIESDAPPLPASKNFAALQPAPPSTFKAMPSIAPAAAAEKPATSGIDDRTAVTSTTSYPWNTLAYFTSTYPSGDSYRCSATLVSPYVAVTAGHCVHNLSRGGYIASGRVSPGQRQNTLGDGSAVRPYASKTDIASVQTTAQWTQMSGNESYPISDYRYDYAAIEFLTPFTHTSTFMPVLYGNTGGAVTSAGYPAVIAGQTAYGLYQDDGNETNRSQSSYRGQHVREFAVDASGGNSGGAFFYTDATTGQRYLVGSLSYGDELDDRSGGPWYDNWNQALISSWVSWVPGREQVAGSTAGLRVASVFSSTQPEMMSYLRFYNAGNSAGTVDVTLADYATGTLLATWRSPNLPARSSRQFSIEDIEGNTSAPFNKSLIYSISVRPTFSGSFQNILWRKADMTETNLSTCDVPERSANTLINVHSSLLDSGYPSGITVHNTSANTISHTFGIYNAADGSRVGTYSTSIAPNSQQILTMANMEAVAGINPGASKIYQYVIKAESGLSGYLQHLVNNRTARLVADMTETCTLTP